MNGTETALNVVDSFGRVHKSFRISVTARCNIRCFYCMPETVQFLPRHDILTFEEIARVAQIAASAGVSRIRLTGGEPLVRGQLWKLVRMLKSIDGIEDVALTTNGILLADQAAQLKAHGLDRVNVSLDTLDPATFEQITRRKGLDNVLAGIDAAIDTGFEKIRINAVSMAGITDSEIIPLAEFARQKRLELRFIELERQSTKTSACFSPCVGLMLLNPQATSNTLTGLGESDSSIRFPNHSAATAIAFG